MKERGVLTYSETKPGELKCTLDLSRLYPTSEERSKFEARFADFVKPVKSDPYCAQVYFRKGDHLVFLSEQLIPKKVDTRTPLLMVFGNPTPRSVVEGMFFSFEGNGREHRFWKHIMEKSGILGFRLDHRLSVKERNIERKRQLLELDYLSQFRVGLSVFLSLPSAGSGSWSGVAGIKRLLGVGAMRKVLGDERTRIVKSAKEFFPHGGIIVTFQKEAWAGLCSEGDPAYDVRAAKKGKLKGSVRGIAGIPLYGLPPTRLVGPCRRVLSQSFLPPSPNSSG